MPFTNKKRSTLQKERHVYFWEVLWVDPRGRIYSLHSSRGYRTADEARRILYVLCDDLDRRIRQRGGKMIDVQIVFSNHQRLRNSDDILN